MASKRLIWIDLEMTGLDVDHDAILEIATIITDTDLNIVAEGPVYAVSQPEQKLMGMDAWNTKQHTQSGLVDRVRASQISVEKAEQATLDFIRSYVPFKSSPMCGNSICQDRRFLYRCMPELEAYFHYRHIDVSSLKMLTRYWAPKLSKSMNKRGAHLAMQDVYDSIEELRYYREHCFAEELSKPRLSEDQ